MEEREDNISNVIGYYEYYSGTKYGANPEIHIKYYYKVNRTKIIAYAEERIDSTGKVIKIYKFSRGTKYSGNATHWKNVIA